MSKVEELLAKYNSKRISTIKLADILDYEQLSKYIARPNSIQSEISKFIK